VREVDTIARLGGDEFGVLLPRTDGDGAAVVANKLLQALKPPVVLAANSLLVAGSIGAAWFPEHGVTAEILFQNAEIAMYAAKSRNLEFTIYAAERDCHAHSRLGDVTELQEGIERDQFVCEYQPLISLKTGNVVGIEALARWQHSRLGLLPPTAFIALAEQTGMIGPLTTLLLDKVLRDWNALYAQLGIPVAVNLSPQNLHDPQIPDRTRDLLHSHGIAPSMLHLEITENCIISDPSRAAKCLTRLHDLGTVLAIDDFGSGYSSLRYLQQLPVDVLKIDRSLVVELENTNGAIVKCAIDMAHTLGLSVVAEGVESAVIRDRLRELGCDTAQGFFLAPPRPARDTLSWIKQQVVSTTAEG
jgi:predicted signal transduction protein with EAL and GGDEF domain